MKKNIYLSIIYIFTIVLVFYASFLYKKSLSIIGDNSFFNMNIVETDGSIYESLYNNIKNYSIENDSFILYLTYYDKKFLNFDNNLKEFIVNKNLKNNFIYLDVNKLNDFDDINKIINDFYGDDYKIDKKDIPLFLYFKNGNIVSIINNFDMNINLVKDKIDELEVN